MKTTIFFTLMGSKNFEFSLKCLNSFFKHNRNEVFLKVLDDGTLSDAEKIELKTELKNISFIDKPARDILINHQLKDYPLLLDFRNQILLAQKLIDPIIYAQEFKLKEINFIDTDVFFYHPFKLEESDGTFSIFMKDSSNAYSFHYLKNFLYLLDYQIYQKINTGLFSIPLDFARLSDFEALLKNAKLRDDLYAIPVWAEQTLWALQCSKNPTFWYDDTEIAIATKNNNNFKGTAIHYVSTFRAYFEEAERDDFKKITLKKSSEHLNSFTFLINRLRAKLK